MNVECLLIEGVAGKLDGSGLEGAQIDEDGRFARRKARDREHQYLPRQRASAMTEWRHVSAITHWRQRLSAITHWSRR